MTLASIADSHKRKPTEERDGGDTANLEEESEGKGEGQKNEEDLNPVQDAPNALDDSSEDDATKFVPSAFPDSYFYCNDPLLYESRTSDELYNEIALWLDPPPSSYPRDRDNGLLKTLRDRGISLKKLAYVLHTTNADGVDSQARQQAMNALGFAAEKRWDPKADESESPEGQANALSQLTKLGISVGRLQTLFPHRGEPKTLNDEKGQEENEDEGSKEESEDESSEEESEGKGSEEESEGKGEGQKNEEDLNPMAEAGDGSGDFQQYNTGEQIMLHFIAMTAQMKRKNECALRKKRLKAHKHVSSLIPQKGILERILENGSRSGELLKNENFHDLIYQASQELMGQKSFDVLYEQSLEERSKKDPENKFDPGSVESIEALIQTKSYQQLMRSASKELMKTKIFKELAPLKSIEELIAYIPQPFTTTERGEEKKNRESDGGCQDDDNRKLFGKKLDQNEMILSLIAALEAGELIVHNPEPKFFDALCYVLETARRSKKLRKLEVVLNRPDEDFRNNIYGMGTVLLTLIQEESSCLESITLQGFDPQNLAEIVQATSRELTELKLLNLERNRLKTNDVMRALEDLPLRAKKVAPLLIQLGHNRIDDEAEIREMLLDNKILAFTLEFGRQYPRKTRSTEKVR